MTDFADPPRRFVLSRAKGSRLPEGAVSVARPTRWGNPWKAEVVDGVGWCCTDTRYQLITEARDRRHAHEMAVAAFRHSLTQDPGLVEDARAKLRGRNLACWCASDMPCHADVWLEIANG